MKRIKDMIVSVKMYAARLWVALDFAVILKAAFFVCLGYIIGINEKGPPPAHYLPESLWEPVHSYRLCMQDRSCVMYVRRVKK